MDELPQELHVVVLGFRIAVQNQHLL